MKILCSKCKYILPIIIISAIIFSACGPEQAVIAPESQGQASPGEVVNPTLQPKVRDDKFVFIPGSSFWMGSNKGDPSAGKSEQPQHKVLLSGFFLMKREVSNFDYEQCVKAGACTPPKIEKEGQLSHYGDPNYYKFPVVGVKWQQALDFCHWMKGDLPTEAMWEKAARGKDARIFPWGEKEPGCDLLNIQGCKEDVLETGSFPNGVSPYGAADMSGNVAEWVSDWFDSGFYKLSPRWSPTGPTQGRYRTVRGGSFLDEADLARTAARSYQEPDVPSEGIGFRCVPVAETYAPICPNTFRRYCEDPKIPPPERGCLPGDTGGNCQYATPSFGCPKDGNVGLTIGAPGITGQGVNLTVNDSHFICSYVDGRLNCSGPEQKMGENATITICGEANPNMATPPTTSRKITLDEVMLASYRSPLLKPVRNTLGGTCPPGYTGNAVNCQQDNNFAWAEGDRTPSPACPQGYFLNQEAGCCLPIPQDNNGCDEMHYRNTALSDRCLPVDVNGCGYGTMPDGYGDCVENPNITRDQSYGEQCPPDLVTNDNGCDFPNPSGATPVAYRGCLADDTGYDGQCNPQPDPQNPCGQGYVSTNNGCVPGYGPGSGCPKGFRLHPRLLCCVPVPGNDDSYCLGDEPGDRANTLATAYLPGEYTTEFEDTGYNPGSNQCEGDLPGGEINCPPGKVPQISYDQAGNRIMTCVGRELPPAQCTGCMMPDPYDPTVCHPGPNCDCQDTIPMATNLQTNSCNPGEEVPRDECQRIYAMTTYDAALGQCVPMGGDCCASGLDFVTTNFRCLPTFLVDGQGMPGGCGDYYATAGPNCILQQAQDTQAPPVCCQSFVLNVPECVGGCPVGERMIEGVCQKQVTCRKQCTSDPKTRAKTCTQVCQ